MLVPVRVNASYKIASSELIVLQNIVGVNLPLLFPEVLVLNRTGSACSLTVEGQTRRVFTNQPDPDFDGTVLTDLFSDFSLSEDTASTLTGLPKSILSSGENIELTLTNAGPAAEALVTVAVRGMIETGVSPDPLVTINV